MIKLLAPVNSYESFRLQKKAGADEIYVGLDPYGFSDVFFSGRIIKIRDLLRICPKKDELKKIVDEAHDSGIHVNFAANIVSGFSNTNGGPSILDLFVRYIEQGLECGVDALIVGCLENILLLKDRNITAPIHSSTFLNTFNINQVRMLKELGVKRVIFPYNITLDEVRDITEQESDLEYEIFGHLGCSNINGTCRLIHNIGEKGNLGIVCRNEYEVEYDGQPQGISPFLDMGLDCSICSLPDIVKLNVHTLKMVGRDISPIYTSAVTRIYKTCLDAVYDGAGIQELQDIVKNIPMHKQFFCEYNRCKYKRTTPVLAHYV